MFPSNIVPFPVFQMKLAAAAGQVPDPVTIPFVVVTQAAAPSVEPAVPLTLRLLPAPITRFMSPVAMSPKVRV